MKKTLAALAFGLGISAPASLDALTLDPCPVETITEYPATPIKKVPTDGAQREQLSLYDKYVYGARYITHYEGSICPITFTSQETTLTF